MKILILLLLGLMSCSKKTESLKSPTAPAPKVNSFNLQDGSYISTEADTSTPYQSEIVQIIEVEENILTFYLGVFSDYSKNQNGELRPGNHPEADFRVNSAAYKITKNGNVFELEFLGSSCNDMNKNPFTGMIPSSVPKIEQSTSSFKIQINAEEVEFNKKDKSQITSLLGMRKNVFCNGEVE